MWVPGVSWYQERGDQVPGWGDQVPGGPVRVAGEQVQGRVRAGIRVSHE